MDYYCKRELLERGWTHGLIEKLLGKPDATKKNPHYPFAAPMKLYLWWRVEQAEGTNTFASRKSKK